MTSYDARPSGCTPFEEELMNAMNSYADSADSPEFDAPAMVRRTRRRRAVGIAAVATAIVVAGGGTALASMTGGTHQGARPAASSTAVSSDATTMLYGFSEGRPFPIDFSNFDLEGAKSYLLKTQTKLGTVSKKAVKGCKPGSVVGLDPHTPKIVKPGDTVNLTICAG
ncbi:hypothetical protein [Streptomyces sp. NBC_00005]|uniref:hypothetical protein n=1 Tax=Streptomyces sp. NBC_00005 TaxID=2903609 RepID=UPI0032506AAF